MAYRLPPVSLTLAIRHLCRYGDTDVFPHLPEIAFLCDQEEAVVAELSGLDLDTFPPMGAIEALGPKSRYGFRIVHQLPLVDTVLLLAAVVEIGPAIEAHRGPTDRWCAFSYRFKPDDSGGLFRTDHTFKAWLNKQFEFVDRNIDISTIITTDISDFYSRINFHRLENLLDEVASGHGAARYIGKHIKAIRARQSFGLPVGGSAARLLAELALTDTDLVLSQDGRMSTRFVDDFRIFLRAEEHPYDVPALLAEQLGLGEGLSLNVSKTRVDTREEFLSNLNHLLSNVSREADGAALDALTSDLYFEDQPDPEKLEKLSGMNLLGFLSEEIRKDIFDMGRIRVIFRALKLAKTPDAIEYIIANFRDLVVFSKDMVLLMEALETDYPGCFDGLSDTIVAAILAPPASSIQLIKTWLLELFVRGVVPIGASSVRKLESLNSPLDRRQINLVRGRIRQQTFFRTNKTQFGHIPPFEQTCFILGATCLPKDEFRAWLITAKSMLSNELGGIFLNWVKEHQETIFSKMKSRTHEH